MISKLQFNLKFNHPSNISFFNLTQIVFLLFSLNIIVKLAVRLHIIFWSKPLHRLFQIYYCICVYLVLYLYFQLKYLLFQNCTWQLYLWRCTLRCCVRIQIYCCICIYLFLCLYFQVKYLLFQNCTWQLAFWTCTLICWVRIVFCCCICIYFFMCLYFHFQVRGTVKNYLADFVR